MAKNASPGPTERLSIESPEIACGSAPWRCARIAVAIASVVHSAGALMADSCGEFLQSRSDRLMIAELDHPVADNLAGFMALAGNQQDIAGVQIGDGTVDRLAPVADLDGSARAPQ